MSGSGVILRPFLGQPEGTFVCAHVRHHSHYILITIDLVSQPHQARPPAELKFSQAETESLTAEVQKMIMKQVVSQIPPQHSNTLIPTFFCPKEGRGHKTHYQPQGSEQICGDSPLQDGGYPHVERYPQNRRLDDKS